MRGELAFSLSYDCTLYLCHSKWFCFCWRDFGVTTLVSAHDDFPGTFEMIQWVLEPRNGKTKFRHLTHNGCTLCCVYTDELEPFWGKPPFTYPIVPYPVGWNIIRSFSLPILKISSWSDSPALSLWFSNTSSMLSKRI